MGNLVAINYDPATAVSKVTTAALAMTALDSTNLRATFTAPANGKVLVRLHGTVHGATTFPAILLGVMDTASAIIFRDSPTGGLKATATATAMVDQEVTAVISGLTAGQSYTWDAAYGVETSVLSTGLKYGGPNDATANNAFGCFQFEIWEA